MVNYFIGFLGFLGTIAFVYAGILMVTAGGAEEQLGKAKKIMIYAGLGILVVILSFSAVSFITKSAEKATGTDSTTTTTKACTSDSDCGSGSLCVNKQCLSTGGNVSGSSTKPKAGSVKGSPSVPAYTDDVKEIDKLSKDVVSKLNISNLSSAAKTKVKSIASTGTLDQKVSNLKNLLKNSVPPLSAADQDIIKNFVYGLTNLKLMKAELGDLYKTMPHSRDILNAYKDTTDALDALIKDSTDGVKSGRFITKYKKLKELIQKYPVVKANITAYPGSGNVPFTVQLDGLNSIDPSGGTISSYKWTYLDSTGNEVSLGSKPVVLHEFTKVNTYAVKLRVATSNTDKDGYKKAADGVSVVRIKANPPTSKVKFRINGFDVSDSYNITLKDGKTGVSFDPSPTTPALGRKIIKYTWYYGDTQSETRLVPTTVVHTYPKAGSYYVKLEVADNVGTVDKRIVKLNVKSLAANIRITPETGNVNTNFKFAGESSRSDDGVIKSYEWKINDSKGNTVASNTKGTFNYRLTKPGTYTAILLVTDITGATDKIVKTFKVISRDPIASFNFTTPKKNHPNQIEFSAIDSYDPDQGDVITYSWDFDGNGTFDIVDSSSPKATYEYKQIGDYKAKLQVKDAFGKVNQVQKKVSVTSVLSADIVTTTLATRVGQPITFSAKSTNAAAYLWEFGDGNKKSTEKTSVTHTYNKTGKFTLKLHFFDKDDNANYETKQILVGAGKEPMAVVTYLINGREVRLMTDLCGKGKDGALVSRSDKIRFDARNSINTDGSTRLLSYDWRFPDGEKSSSKETTFKFAELSKKGECFTASLVVRDQLTGKLSKKNEVYFKVTNKLPKITDFVITPPSKKKAVTPVKIALKAVNPKDDDGTVKKFTWWYYLDGYPSKKMGVHTTTTNSTDMTITSFGTAGVKNKYYFVVEATDGDGGAYNSSDRFGSVSYLDITNGPNLSPVANFSVDKTTISAGDSISFVSSSYDPQGETLPNSAYKWDFDGDGSFDDTTSGPQVNRQFNTPGTYKVRLKVVHRGLSSSSTKQINVETTESLPQAAFTYSVNGSTVSFDASNTRFDSTLKDTNLRFEWDFDADTDSDGNGTKDDDVQAKTIKASNSYAKKGEYKVKLTVKDSLGQKGIVARTVDLSVTDEERKKNAYNSIRVTSAQNPLTTLDIDIIPASLKKGKSADINVSVINADGSLYNGKVYFSVLEGSGSFTPNPVKASNSKASSIFKSSDAGTMKIRVKATDTVYGDISQDALINVK